jgi:hypothetical protein
MDDLEEVVKRCNIYAYLAGKQLGAIMALTDIVHSDLLSMGDIKEKLSEIIRESTEDADKYLYSRVSRA